MANYDRVNHAYDQAAAYDANLIPGQRTFIVKVDRRKFTLPSDSGGISKAKLAKWNQGYEGT